MGDIERLYAPHSHSRPPSELYGHTAFANATYAGPSPRPPTYAAHEPHRSRRPYRRQASPDTSRLWRKGILHTQEPPDTPPPTTRQQLGSYPSRRRQATCGTHLRQHQVFSQPIFVRGSRRRDRRPDRLRYDPRKGLVGSTQPHHRLAKQLRHPTGRHHSTRPDTTPHG